MEKRATVIGGGIGGLATAIALGRDGWRVTVHERDDTLPATGTALGIWPAALAALDALGVGDEVREAGVRQRAGEFRRPDGSRIATIDATRNHICLLSRPGLLAILHRAAGQGAELLFGQRVEHADPRGYDLLVGADGVFSRVREHLFGAAYGARYSGSTAWRGVVENLPTDTFVETWGRGVKFGVTPQEGGRTNWFASAAVPEGRFSPGAEVATLRRMFDGWAEPVRTVLDRIGESSVLRHDVYVVPPLPSYVAGNTALIGDAAHAMAPDLGRGACEAVIDAVTLAACLRETPSVPAALAAYDRRRRRVTRRLTRVARLAARMSHVRHALPVRDRLLWASLLAGPPA